MTDISIPRSLAERLLKVLYTPTKDREGATVYTINLNLASELRLALEKGKEGE